MFTDDDARGAGKPRRSKLQVMLTREEHQAVRRAALERGEKVATMVRRLLAKEVGRG